MKHVCGIFIHLPTVPERVATEIGEVERFVGFEECARAEEGFALVLQVDGRPFAEVGLRYSSCSDIPLGTAGPISLMTIDLVEKGRE